MGLATIGTGPVAGAGTAVTQASKTALPECGQLGSCAKLSRGTRGQAPSPQIVNLRTLSTPIRLTKLAAT